jgi:DNA-binding winged helix-turn-helix (wHTH) protein/predicted ATPase
MRVVERPIRALRFGAFTANVRAGELFKGSKKIKLQEQPFRILAMLLQRPGEVVTREELRGNLWAEDTLVDFDHGINVAINKIRVALGESSNGQRFVETVGKRGYRFVQTVKPGSEKVEPYRTGSVRETLALRERHSVGRTKEAGQLRDAFESATAGRGLLVCVTGEAGIGKTTLVENFLADLSATGQSHLVGQGRSSERLAGAEAYMPILEAFESVLRADEGRRTARLMKRVAPLWHAQIALGAPSKSAVDSTTQLAPTSQERLKREVVAFLREASVRQPIILFLDDVQWADLSTVDLLGYVAAHLDSLAVLIVAAYRPSELLPAKHPFSTLQLDLQTRGLCSEMPVELLSRDEIESYLDLEFPDHVLPPTFSEVIHSKTEGNALFMVDVVRYLRTQGLIASEGGHWRLVQEISAIERGIPQSVRSMIQRKIEQLEEADRDLLVTAAVQGYEFESAVVAGALDRNAVDVEERLNALDRLYGFVRAMGELELPNRGVTVRYQFVHVLYQNAFYDLLGPTRRSRLSTAVAEAILSFQDGQIGPVASRLAILFDSAQDAWRASGYYLLAIQNATRVFAHDEVIALAQKGLDSLRTTPETHERTERELQLQVALAFSVSYTRGFAAEVTAREMARTLEICSRLGDSPQLFAVWYAMFIYYLISSDLDKAQEMGERLLALAEATHDPILLLGAHTQVGTLLHMKGAFVQAHDHLERAVALHDPLQIMSYVAIYRTDPGLVARSQSISNLYLLGYLDQAYTRMQETLSLARQGSDRGAAGVPLAFAAFFYQFVGQAEEVLRVADECLELSRDHAIPQQQAWVSCIRGWAIAEKGQVVDGIAEIRASLALLHAAGAVHAWPFFLAVLAEAAARGGRTEEGLAAVAEGLEVAEKQGEHLYDAELYRLKGELLLTEDVSNASKAEACFCQAIDIARQQAAKSLELRAAISLSRLWLKKGRQGDVRELLSAIYGWFTEGFDMPDLKAAAALLEQVR